MPTPVFAKRLTMAATWATAARFVDGEPWRIATLGDPLLFRAMEWMFFGARAEGMDLMLHPVGFAGWVGLFLTSIHLLPIGLLDGGQIAYAAFGQTGHRIAWATFLGLAVLTLVYGFFYVSFLIALLIYGVRHPPTQNDHLALGGTRRRLAFAMLLIFVLCFSPVPIQF